LYTKEISDLNEIISSKDKSPDEKEKAKKRLEDLENSFELTETRKLIELEKAKRERLLYKLGFYKVNQIKNDDFKGGVNYGTIEEQIVYFDIGEKDLKELEKLQTEVDSYGNVPPNNVIRKTAPNIREVPFISTTLTVLGITIMILSVLVYFLYLANQDFSYIGFQMFLSSVLSGLFLIGFSSIIKYLSEIAENTKKQ
jgi:hypothetical protein